MKFYVTKEVFEKIPNAQFGLLSIENIDNSMQIEEIKTLLNLAISATETHFENKNVKEEIELTPYRNAFRNMSINPNKYPPSIQALLMRITKKKGMPSINPIVDLGNSISIKYCLPVGIHDLNTINVDFCVRTSNENDVFLPFGAKETESVDVDEVVYATSNKIRTRRWIWRQSEEGKITENTKDLLFIIDGFNENLETILKAREELAELLKKYFNVNVKIGLINSENKEYETK